MKYRLILIGFTISLSSFAFADEPAPTSQPEALPDETPTTPATAKAAAPSDSDAALARQYYVLGKGLYERGDYEGALVQFKQAYRNAKRPALLFNIARCHEYLGQWADAVAALEAYLKYDPPDAKPTQTRIQNLQKRMAKKQQEEDVKTQRLKRLESEKKANEQRLAEAQRRAKAEKRKALASTSRSRKTSRASDWKGTAGWIVASLGIAAAATGGILGALAKGKSEEVSEAASNKLPYDQWQASDELGATLGTASLGALIAGGTLAVGGAVLLILHYTGGEKRTNTAWVAPSVSPQGDFSFSGGFQF